MAAVQAGVPIVLQLGALGARQPGIGKEAVAALDLGLELHLVEPLGHVDRGATLAGVQDRKAAVAQGPWRHGLTLHGRHLAVGEHLPTLRKVGTRRYARAGRYQQQDCGG